MILEFKKFIARGNVIDLAVGVVMGGAFSAIVTSLVNDIIMPFIGLLVGGLDFTSMAIKIGDAEIKYGSFIQNIVNFLIIAVSIFMFIKIINKIVHKEDKKESKKEDPQIKILKEIRDELKKNAK